MGLRVEVPDKHHWAELRIHVVLVEEALQTLHDVECVRILYEIFFRIPMEVCVDKHDLFFQRMVLEKGDLPIHIYIKCLVVEFYSLSGKIDFFVLFHRKYVSLPCNSTTIGARSEEAFEVITESI